MSAADNVPPVATLRREPVVRRVVVVIPARNEEACIGVCVAAAQHAIDRLTHDRPQVSAQIVVVADRCTDATASVAARAGALVVRSTHGNVGAARHAGVERALAEALADGIAPDETWVAGTDADTIVPSHWLTRQINFAAQGMDAVIGTVIPGDVQPPLLDAWLAEHSLTEGHPHVHGANLALRGSAYLAIGGFAPMALHEDVHLVERLRRSGLRSVATDTVRVTTSGRRDARASGGFGDYLVALNARLQSEPGAVLDGPPPADGASGTPDVVAAS